MTIGTHGMQHRPWRSLDDEGYREELDAARELLEAAAGARVDEAACPYGAYDRRALRALKQRDFRRVYSVDRRPARPDAWFRPRYVIRRGDSASKVSSVRPRLAVARARARGEDDGQAMALSGPLVLVGFGEAYAAIETHGRWRDAGFRVAVFTRRGARPAVRRVRGVELHEVAPPEAGVERTLEDLRSLIGTLELAAFMPLDDGSVLLSGALEGVTIAGPTGKRVDYALDKALQVEAARAAGLHVPPTTIVTSAEELEVKEFPAFVKPARALYEVDGRLTRPTGSVVADEEELQRVADEEWHPPLLVQPLLEGVGEGVFGLVAKDGVTALSAHRRVRMLNPQGSASSRVRVDRGRRRARRPGRALPRRRSAGRGCSWSSCCGTPTAEPGSWN